MNIGFDASPIIQSVGGVACYARNLLKALLDLGSEDGFVGYVPLGASPKLNWPQDGGGEFLKWVEVGRYNFRQRGAIDRLDVYHGTNFKIQTSGRSGTVLTIHDLWLDRHPEYSKKLFGQRLSFYRTRRRARFATRIIADSQFTASEVQELYGIPASKISVIHLGVSDEFSPDLDNRKFFHLQHRYGLPSRPYILFVGGADPRKNHRTLFQAFAHHPHLKGTHDLIAVGSHESRGESLLKTSDSLGLSEKVYCVGSVSKEDLRLLYSFAVVFVYPSHYEGFGLPVLEAMACGVPVITSNTSALPEVVGEAAVLVNPKDDEELARAIDQLLGDSARRQLLRAKGFQRFKHFTWIDSASRTLDLYRSLCG